MNQTDAERKLWFRLRDRRLNGIRFKRQVPISGYFVDFYCFDASLVVEVDGGQHSEARAAYDGKRTAALEALGLRVIRFWNNDVLQNIEGVLTEILAACQAKVPHPYPLPQAGEGAEPDVLIADVGFASLLPDDQELREGVGLRVLLPCP